MELEQVRTSRVVNAKTRLGDPRFTLRYAGQKSEQARLRWCSVFLRRTSVLCHGPPQRLCT